MGSKDHMDIVKGKRTKRSRPLSPIPFANSTYNEDDQGGFEDVEMKNCTQYLSPSSSSDYQDNTTEEEEDLANCLILLAQGRSRESDNLRGRDRPNIGVSNETGKARCFVYECKTCNRTFPSFQALGGHRASHKKPKLAMVDEKNTRLFESAYEEEGPNNNNRGLNGNYSKVKVHECSICGAEFTSGQALGGHMRRHRGSIGSGNANVMAPNTALPLTLPLAKESEKPPNVLCLSLDLNLPAPEDDRRESEFAFASKQQQQSSLVFSAPPPTLVDCHY
ncbi:hypothetical protein like AT5G04390 [Hibiscus trionum]|uniref:C2H2-type domain-containing protein n=1 Tax=Hibiscus trionum TaxID=183268 RepID=A0A9W7I279_HIBTR|nr:hypothetical protein like AT5G04390 [Hibiscus trionum]